MSLEIDSREIPVQIPRVPESEAGLLSWAKALVVALTQRDSKAIFSPYTPDYAGSLTFSQTISNILRVITTAAVGDCTISARPGKIGPAWVIINNDASAPRTITFGSGFQSSGPLIGTASKSAVVEFISDGTTLYEVARTLNL